MYDVSPPGFVGLDPRKPVTIRRRHLPHWRQKGASYFVTFRLADSLPRSKLNELRRMREHWESIHPNPSDEEQEDQLRETMTKVEKWLDQGAGSCALRHAEVTEIVEGRLRYFAGQHYELFSFVIMPNHVHAAVKPLADHDLDEVLQAWKSVSATLANRKLNRQGRLWQEETFDRIIRDGTHLRRVVRYIEANPGKAGVSARCWTTPAWDEWLRRGE